MEEEDSATGLYRPHMEAHNQSSEQTVPTLELRNIDGCEPIHDFDDSQLVGAPAILNRDSVVGAGGVPPTAGVETKRKRGRPPKGQVKSPAPKKNNEEEDVCFICFDGGSLVLCDRRGCPKAYHPSCIKRDEAFFKSKARWNCGWHICSSCQKAAHYMCYTCTYSLCKGCTKDADYACVRGNKGFCTTCMRTIMLIENQQGDKETAQVDFDDTSSWEYLFKVYWIYLKGKLSLTINELTQAKNPWKGPGTMGSQGQSSDLHYGVDDVKGSISDSSFGQLESNSSKRRKTKHYPEFLNKDSLSITKSSTDKGITSIGCIEWASKELLEFVAHMKNGDTSVLSQFDVQALLLEYIKRNNLRDPHKKSQIICDLRLKNLFGKPCVGHFEMLKLLEYHFLIEDSPKSTFIQCSIVDAIAAPAEAGENSDNLLMMGNEKRRRTRKKGEERVPQPNLDEYAAIDAHNINLIYLRRSLMESLIEDNEKFHDKVVGSIVRIRISGTDQKQDIYRLVQVVGTSKVAVPYKLGERAVDVMLDILNLDKKEGVLIDAISNQEFSEDECRRLRQSIKCGLVKRLTVGDVQEKAMAIRAVKLNDWLETEILRLNHLRDRASEKGHKKDLASEYCNYNLLHQVALRALHQLRECVEKLQLLKTPEERQRRLHEIPEVHADPRMDPNYESEDGGELSDKKQDKYVRPKYSGFSRSRREPIAPQKVGDTSSDKSGRALKNLVTSERNKIICTTIYSAKEDGPTCNERKDACVSNGLERPRNPVDSACSAISNSNNQDAVRSGSFSGVATETSIATLPIGVAPFVSDDEIEKLWHYRDPNGKIQGPFCMVQLRKWSTTGYFPPDMRIWGINDKESESLLLNDVLNGQFHKAFPSLHEVSLQSPEVGGASDRRSESCDGRSSESMNTTVLNGKQSEENLDCNDRKSPSNAEDELGGSNAWGSHYSSHQQNSFKAKASCSDQPQMHSPLPSSTVSGHQYGAASHQGRGQDGETWNSNPIHGNLPQTFQPIGGQCHENQSDGQGHSGQSSGQNWKPLPVNSSSNNRDNQSKFSSAAKSPDSPEQNHETDNPNFPSPTPKTYNEWEGQAAGNKLSILLSVLNEDSHICDLPSPTQEDSHIRDLPSPAQEDSHILDLPSPTPKSSNGDEKGEAAENKQSVSSNLLVQDSGPSWSSASSLVVGNGAQLAERGDEWRGYSPFPSKPSVEEMDSGLASASSLKVPEPISDHAAAPTPNSEQIIHSSPSHPLSNASSWQAIVTEPIEFSTLAEESVSDLLAEVDAMESQCGLASPTSAMTCAGDMIHGSRNDCFSSIEGFSLTDDLGKNDALSSTTDIQLPSVDEPLGLSEGYVDPVKSSGGQSSTNAEVAGETNPIHVSLNLCEADLNVQPTATSTMSQNMVDINTALGAQSEAMDLDCGASVQRITNMDRGTSQEIATGNANVNIGASAGNMDLDNGGSVQRITSMDQGTSQEIATAPDNMDLDCGVGSVQRISIMDRGTSQEIATGNANVNNGTSASNMDLDSGGSVQRITNMDRRASQETATGNANVNMGAPAGNTGRESRPRYGGERVSGPRDRGLQSGDSGLGRGRASWNWQSSSGGGGSYPMRPHIRERVCKFYERGHCKKGASCGYLHR